MDSDAIQCSVVTPFVITGENCIELPGAERAKQLRPIHFIYTCKQFIQ